MGVNRNKGPFGLKLDGKRLSLPAAALLTLVIARFAHFFLVAGSSGLEAIASWTYFTFVVAVFFMIHITGRVSTYRRLFFVTFALLFIPSFIAILFEDRGHLALTTQDVMQSEVPFCHIVIPFILLPYTVTKTVIFPGRLAGHFASIYGMLIIWIVASLAIGRGWCSWACFYGGLEAGVARIRKKPILDLSVVDDRVRYFAFAMLAFTVLASLVTLSAVYCEWFCPFKTVTEGFEVTDLSTHIAFVMYILLFAALVIVLPYLTKRRFQCATFCPFGAFQSLVDRALNIYRVHIDTDRCVQCMKCVSVCPTLSIKEENIREEAGRPLLTCTKCGECMQACTQGAIDYRFAFTDPRRPTLLGLAARKTESLGGPHGWLLHRGVITAQEILSPRALFTVSGFTLGIILSSRFGPDTIHRLLSLAIDGTFLP